MEDMQRQVTQPPRQKRKRTGKRMLLACVNCKTRKLRCDNQIPACANCERSGSVCLVEDPATKRQQPRNYLETLEQRVSQLENQLRQEVSKHSHQDSTFSEVDFPDTSSQHLFSADWSSQSGKVGSTEPTGVETEDHQDIDEIATRVGLLSVAAGAEPRYLGPSSAMTLCRIINPSLLRAIPKSSRPLRSDTQSSSISSPFVLPDAENCFKLSNAYFDQIHTQYPFLHEPTFRACEAQCLPLDTTNPSELGSYSLFSLYMVYAIGALLLPDLSHLSEHLCSMAQIYMNDVLQDDSLDTIHVYLFFAVYSIRSPTGTSVWKCSGLALRQCIELGYHRNQRALGVRRDSLRYELQKRAFWCAWSINCLTATILGRPLGLQSYEIDCELPLDVEDTYIINTGIIMPARPHSPQDPPTTLTKGIQTFRIRHLWGEIYTSLYSNIAESNPSHPTYESRTAVLRQKLEAWKASVPHTFPLGSNQVVSFFTSDYWYEFSYNYTCLYLYRGHLINLGSGLSDSLAMELFRTSGTLCHDVRNRLLGKSTTYTWGALHTIFISGLTYLHCLWSSPAVRSSSRYDQVSRTCTNCTVMLVLIAQWNEEAEPYRDIFETLATRTLTMLTETSVQDKPDPNISQYELNNVSQWASTLFDTGMTDGSDRLLNDLINMIS